MMGKIRMTETEKLALKALSAADQWESVEKTMLQSCPSRKLLDVFIGSVAAESAMYELSPNNTVELMAATILRNTFHREVMRRVNSGELVLEDEHKKGTE